MSVSRLFAALASAFAFLSIVSAGVKFRATSHGGIRVHLQGIRIYLDREQVSVWKVGDPAVQTLIFADLAADIVSSLASIPAYAVVQGVERLTLTVKAPKWDRLSAELESSYLLAPSRVSVRRTVLVSRDYRRPASVRMVGISV